MCKGKSLEYTSNSFKESILKAIREELHRLNLEDIFLNEFKGVIRDVFERRLTKAINDINFPLLLKTVLKEILEPIVVRSIEEVNDNELFILRLIDKSRKSTEFKY